MKRIIVLMMGVLLMSHLSGQEYFIPSENITIENGLNGNNINLSYQDTKGFMWFGTRNGLSHYDGYKITNYNSRDEISISQLQK